MIKFLVIGFILGIMIGGFLGLLMGGIAVLNERANIYQQMIDLGLIEANNEDKKDNE